MKTTKLNKVLIALDYDPTARKVAEVGFAMANAMKAEVTLLHIISDPVYYSSTAYSPIMGLSGEVVPIPVQIDSIEGLKAVSLDFLEKFKHHLGDDTIKIRVEEGDFASVILTTAKSIHADAIVMGSHSKKWLENIVLGSVTADVLRQTTIPLFVVPTKKNK